MRIAHITLFHRPLNSRIFWRQCRTPAQVGHGVVLIAPDAGCSIQQGFHFYGLVSGGSPGGIGNRLWQSLRRGWQAVRIAKSLRADVCHLHEVQCGSFGLLLKFLGIRIIYDIHEDAFPKKILTPVRSGIRSWDIFSRWLPNCCKCWPACFLIGLLPPHP